MLPKIENAPAGVTAPAEAAGTGLQATAPATNDSIPPRRKQAVSAILPHGAASAVDSLTLVNMLGYKDRRELTQQIERERQAGKRDIPPGRPCPLPQKSSAGTPLPVPLHSTYCQFSRSSLQAKPMQAY